MLQVVQAFDREPIAEIPTDDGDALEAKLESAARAFRDRDAWPKTHGALLSCAGSRRPRSVTRQRRRPHRKAACGKTARAV